ALHLLGAGLWLGTLTHLAVVAWVGPAEGRVARLSALIAAFSPLALGAYNWRVARPRLARGEGDDVFRRSAWIELSLGALLLLITSLLVALPAPGLD
ncbi:MAG TPA: hypothetical protein VL295_06160, partial [Gemmatimonadales bacterium]|nr:hypothetical protein [Gemmatimonadales bacterium]